MNSDVQQAVFYQKIAHSTALSRNNKRSLNKQAELNQLTEIFNVF